MVYMLCGDRVYTSGVKSRHDRCRCGLSMRIGDMFDDPAKGPACGRGGGGRLPPLPGCYHESGICVIIRHRGECIEMFYGLCGDRVYTSGVKSRQDR